MEGQWKIEFWGTRGSMPVPGKDFLKYGGDTSCVLLDWGCGLVIFDGGSGLAKLGKALAGEKRRIDILLSHMHMDHIVGLLGFKRFYDKEARIHLYGEAGDGGSFRKRLETVAGRPYWPVEFKDFAGDVRLHQIEAGQSFSITEGPGSIKVSTIRGKHPGESILYRIDGPGKSVVYGLDCQLDQEMFEKMAEFSQNVQVLIWDANFTEEELRRYRDWGHSSWRQGIALRKAANAKNAVMTHFSWEYTDDFLTEQESLAAMEDPASFFARERMVLWV